MSVGVDKRVLGRVCVAVRVPCSGEGETWEAEVMCFKDVIVGRC